MPIAKWRVKKTPSFPVYGLIHAYQFETTDALGGYADSIGDISVVPMPYTQIIGSHIGSFLTRAYDGNTNINIALTGASAPLKCISFWIKFSGAYMYRFNATLFKGGTSFLNMDSGNLYWSLTCPGAIASFYSWGDGFPYEFWHDETWHHCVVQNEEGTPVFWLDNTRMPFPYANGFTVSTNIFAPSALYTVGIGGYDVGRPFSMDQIYFYTDPLTPEQIQFLHQETIPLDPTNIPMSNYLVRLQ